jgi:hypothetical protein
VFSNRRLVQRNRFFGTTSNAMDNQCIIESTATFFKVLFNPINHGCTADGSAEHVLALCTYGGFFLTVTILLRGIQFTQVLKLLKFKSSNGICT